VNEELHQLKICVKINKKFVYFQIKNNKLINSRNCLYKQTIPKAFLNVHNSNWLFKSLLFYYSCCWIFSYSFLIIFNLFIIFVCAGKSKRLCSPNKQYCRHQGTNTKLFQGHRIVVFLYLNFEAHIPLTNLFVRIFSMYRFIHSICDCSILIKPDGLTQDPISLVVGPVQVRRKTNMSKNLVDSPGWPVIQMTQQNLVKIFFLMCFFS
jgi:hypothetical protein